jgi:hypothetical protein
MPAKKASKVDAEDPEVQKRKMKRIKEILEGQSPADRFLDLQAESRPKFPLGCRVLHGAWPSAGHEHDQDATQHL